MRILGVDPGSRLTGYGCIDVVGNQLQHVAHGTLRLSNTGGKTETPLEERLLAVYQGLSTVILEFEPEVMVVERVFFARNAMSALKLGQARGAIILTGKIHSLKIAEYSPTEVKQTVAGHGQADKEQVARMVQMLVGRQKFATSDASDGLALALCHACFVGSPLRQGAAKSNTLKSWPDQRKKKKLSLAESLGIHLTKKV